jgi:hypothetical protein
VQHQIHSGRQLFPKQDRKSHVNIQRRCCVSILLVLLPMCSTEPGRLAAHKPCLRHRPLRFRQMQDLHAELLVDPGCKKGSV